MKDEEEKRGIESKIRRYAKELVSRGESNKSQAITAVHDYKVTFEAYAEIQEVIARDLFKIIGDIQD